MKANLQRCLKIASIRKVARMACIYVMQALLWKVLAETAIIYLRSFAGKIVMQSESTQKKVLCILTGLLTRVVNIALRLTRAVIMQTL